MSRSSILSVAAAICLAAPMSTTALGGVVRASNLVGWWMMGEGAAWNGSSWTVPDASGAGNAGASVRMLQTDRVAGYPFTPYVGTSYAMQFDGTADSKYVSIPYSPSLVMTSSFTLCAWVRQSTAVAGDAMIVDRCDPNEVHNYALQLENSQVSMSFYDDYYANHGLWPWPKVNGATTLNLNQWYAVAGVFDNTAHTLTVYLDGVQDAQLSILGGSPDGSSLQGVAIGGEPAENLRWFSGSIDDVRIYNAALSASDIAAIYNGGRGDFAAAPEPSSLVLLGACAVVLLGYGCRRRRRAASRQSTMCAARR